MEMLLSFRGEELLRVKGVLNLEGQTQPIVMQSVQTLLYPLARLDAWPDDDQRTRLVFIVRDIEPRFVEDVLNQFIEAARTPGPDAGRTEPTTARNAPGPLVTSPTDRIEDSG
jgi:hypothetical protein